MNQQRTPSTSRILLPEPTLRRLPWYLAFVTKLATDNVEYVSSTRIADELNVDSSQIAKDLSFLNIKGKTRIGYEVKMLERVLSDFLGFRSKHNAVMIGAGSLGAALMADSGLQRYGLDIIAGCDTNPAIAGSSIGGIPVISPDELASFVSRNKVVIAIIAVPYEAAQQAADHAIAAGIRAIWNFTPCRIRVADNIVVQNTSIYSHLAVMYNRINESGR